uniref:FBD domain-containing protein n=1 Tax=Populus trichocarpa TaxID=3694 RepID=A0A2K1ZFE4_POPTR
MGVPMGYSYLVLEDKCVRMYSDRPVVENRIVKFITHALFLHQGPVHKFQLSTSYLHCFPDIDQWMLFLSRSDIKELVLELGEGDCLGCPLLESLALSYFDSLALNICAPNLKCLCLEGEFTDICLENTPLLVVMSVSMYMNDDIAEYFEQSWSCNFIKFLGGVPLLERLVVHIYFAKYLSIGDYPGTLAITYSRLKIIELYQVSFEDTKEIRVVLCLITNSPHLKDFRISGSSTTVAAVEVPDLGFWAEECPEDCTFKQLKVVKMTDMSGVPHEMEFLKFLLANSPVLETLCITPCVYVMDGILNMLVQLVRFRSASAEAEITFTQDETPCTSRNASFLVDVCDIITSMKYIILTSCTKSCQILYLFPSGVLHNNIDFSSSKQNKERYISMY